MNNWDRCWLLCGVLSLHYIVFLVGGSPTKVPAIVCTFLMGFFWWLAVRKWRVSQVRSKPKGVGGGENEIEVYE